MTVEAAFQPNAFQQDAFQADPVTAFQADAFQQDAFQIYEITASILRIATDDGLMMLPRRPRKRRRRDNPDIIYDFVALDADLLLLATLELMND